MTTSEHYVQAVLEDARDSPHSFIQGVCLPFLTSSQNADGGWGYQPGSPSSVEATAWALAAHAAATQEGSARTTEPASARRMAWLHQAQLADGSWPAVLGQSAGCWATSLACLALERNVQSTDRVSRGLMWLVESWPAEGGWRSRFLARLSRKPAIVRQDSSLKGWSWTPGTASWVEPTAYALLALSLVPERLHPAGAAERIRLAEQMLYDRMCPEGGWNSGNPQVYGVPGVPKVGPTVWALLALRHHRERAEIGQSLKWLENHFPSIRGPASLALAHLGLTAYGQRVPPLAPALWALYGENQFLRSVLVHAWAAIALGVRPRWTMRSVTEYEL